MRTFILLFFLPFSTLAQSDFLKDSDIVWAIEIEQDWALDIPSIETEYLEGINTLKLLRTPQNEGHWLAPFLPNLVFQAAYANKFPVFTDPKCQNLGDIQVLTHYVDTIVQFDKETYEEIIKIVQAEILPSRDVKGWRLRQVLAYHRKSASWSTTVESIAPLVEEIEPAGDTFRLRPLFWFKPNNIRPNLGSNDIVWAKETRNRQPKTQVDLASKQLVKVTDGYLNPMPHQLGVMKTNAKTPFFSAGIDRLMTHKERMALLVKTDTIFSVYPGTFEEKIAVEQTELDPGDIHELRLIQSWYWDERKGQLSICLDAVGPMLDVFDKLGNLKYSLILFYQKAKL